MNAGDVEHDDVGHGNDDDDDDDLPPGLLQRLKDGPPPGMMRRMSVMMSALHTSTNDGAEEHDRPPPGLNVNGAFKLLAQHPNLSIVPENIRKFYFDLDHRIEEVERKTVEMANTQINHEILDSLDDEEDVLEAIASLEKGQDLEIPDALPKEYATERVRKARYRNAEIRRWFEDRKKQWKNESESFRIELRMYLSEDDEIFLSDTKKCPDPDCAFTIESPAMSVERMRSDLHASRSIRMSASQDTCDDWIETTLRVTKLLKSEEEDFNSVIVTAGGWAGGHIGEAEGLRSVDTMWKRCVQSAATGGHIASNTLAPDGLFLLTGASAALSGTSFMAGYGMAKAATHHLVRSVANGDLPEGCVSVGILPETIDTDDNRRNMPDADFTTWTPESVIADKVLEWSTGNGMYR
eukprot:g1248.t1